MSTDVLIEPTARTPGESRRDDAATRKTKRARKRVRIRLLTMGFAVLLVTAAVVAAWPKPLVVEEAPVRVDALEVTVDEPGRARVRDRYVVYAPLGGDVARIELRPGDAVGRGTQLANVMPASPALLDPRTRVEATARVAAADAAAAQTITQVARAETAFRDASEDLDASRKLFASGSIAAERLRHDELAQRLREQELAAARFSAKVASHEADVARAALRRYSEGPSARDPFVVTSPVSGRVLRVLHESAGVVAPGTALLEIGDPESLEIVVEVLTADAVRIAAGAPARLERWGGEKALEGHVRLVEPSAFTKISALGVEEQRVNVLLDIDDPRQTRSRLGDGYRVEARIVTWKENAVVVVPAGAVFRRGDDWAVFVDVDARARLRTVHIGQRGAHDVQILSGVSTGDRVIVHPSTAVSDGARVKAP